MKFRLPKWLRRKKKKTLVMKNARISFMDPAFPGSGYTVHGTRTGRVDGTKIHESNGPKRFSASIEIPEDQRPKLLKTFAEMEEKLSKGRSKEWERLRTYHILSQQGRVSQARAIAEHYLRHAKMMQELNEILDRAYRLGPEEATWDTLELMLDQVQSAHARDLGIELKWETGPEEQPNNYEEQYNPLD